jgi:hypothetical protein
MSENESLLGSGMALLLRNKRYIFWFWVLNLTLAEFGASAFRKNAHAIMDHSLYGDRLLHGFDVSVLTELLLRPDFGSTSAVATPAFYFAFLFFLATALFLPGVFQGYASAYRLPREDFFRACGRNLWRFIRLMVAASLVMGIVAGILFAIRGAVVTRATESTNEVLPVQVGMTGLAVIFLVMTTLRIWFDLAEADVVLNDQRAVRKSIVTGFRHTFRSLGRLLASYVVAAVVAAVILVGGIWMWNKFVPTDSIVRAFLVGQLILFLLLASRFWQRGVAVSYWKQRMMVAVAAVQPLTPQPVAGPAVAQDPPATMPTPAATELSK